MLDGALQVGGPGTEHIKWLSPMEVFAIRLNALIAQRLRSWNWEEMMARARAQAEKQKSK